MHKTTTNELKNVYSIRVHRIALVKLSLPFRSEAKFAFYTCGSHYHYPRPTALPYVMYLLQTSYQEHDKEPSSH